MESIIAIVVLGISLSAGSILYFYDRWKTKKLREPQEVAPLLGVVAPKKQEKSK